MSNNPKYVPRYTPKHLPSNSSNDSKEINSQLPKQVQQNSCVPANQDASSSTVANSTSTKGIDNSQHGSQQPKKPHHPPSQKGGTPKYAKKPYPNHEVPGSALSDPKSRSQESQQHKIEEQKRLQEKERLKREQEAIEQKKQAELMRLQKEEEQRIAEEEAKERARKEEEEVKKREEEAKKREEEAHAQQELKGRQHLLLLRKKNLEAELHRPDASHFKSLQSAIAKNTAFAKKCNKVGADTVEALIKEMKTLNLTKYISEIASNIASSTLKPTDLDATVQFCSELHHLYSDFAIELQPGLLRVISPTSKVELSPRRMILRLYLELYIVGVFNDESIFHTVVKDVLDTKDPKQLPATLQMVLSFVRSGGRDILGIVPKSQLARIEKFLKDGYFTEKDPVPYELVMKGLIGDEKRKQLITALTQFYNRVSTVLVQSCKKLRDVEQKNNEILANRHELPAEVKTAYLKQLEQFENFQKTVVSLADMLHLEVPNLPQAEKITRIKENKHQQRDQNETDNEDFGCWESDESKKFYESLPDLKESVSIGLLGLVEQPSSSGTTAETPSTSETPSASTTAPSEETPEASTNAPDTLIQFYERLLKCSNRQLVDTAAVEFVRLSKKGWRPKLATLMFQSNRNRVDNLRYFSRFIAILHPYFKDMATSLLKKLEDEFDTLFKQKEQIHATSKLWNVRFFGELTKFKICPGNTVMTQLKKCLDDFIGVNVQIACEIVETCGYFLMHFAETKSRMSNLLDMLTQLKNTKHLPISLEILVDNAIQTARPVERTSAPIIELSPIQLYIQKLLYLELSKDTLNHVVTQLRKLSWPDEESFLLKTMLKVYKNKYQHIHLIASIVSQLSQYHDSFGVKFVDCLLEKIRVDLESRKFASHQKLVMNITLLGELVNSKVAEAKLFWKMLYTLIRYNTITVPKSGPTDFPPSKDGKDKENNQAWIEDSFRIRLVCTLMMTCPSYTRFDTFPSTAAGRLSYRDMERFLLYFQRFLFWQRFISPDLSSLLDDAWTLIKPPYLFTSFKELCDKAEQLLQNKPSFRFVDEQLSLPYKISSNSQNEEVKDDEEEVLAVEMEPEIMEAPPQVEEAEMPVQAPLDPIKVQEDELSKLFDSMMSESMSQRTNVVSKANSIFTVPLVALKKKAEIIKPTIVEDYNAPPVAAEEDEDEDEEDDEEGEDLEEDGEDEGVDDDEEDEEEDEDEESLLREEHGKPSARPAKTPAMNFQFLMRKPGKKTVLNSIDIPVDSNMVKRHLHIQEKAQQEREALHAVTMKLVRLGEETDAKREQTPQAPIGMMSQKTPTKVQPTSYSAAVEQLTSSGPKKTYVPPSLDNLQSKRGAKK